MTTPNQSYSSKLMDSFKTEKCALTVILFLVLTGFGFGKLEAQPAIQKDSIADFEIPYIVGEAREMTLRFIDDLNSLHANIPEDAKATIFGYIYDAFEDGENARVLSDLKYDRPVYSLMRANPVSMSKYALDYELDPDINKIILVADSFRFTFPENVGPHQYEMYGAYSQYFVNIKGDTLQSKPFVKLAGYVATRDSITKRFGIKLRSIVFLDETKLPDFMLPEELAGLTQKYFEWKKSGSSVDNLEMMSDEAFKETLRKAQEKRANKEALLLRILAKYDHAKERNDIVGAAQEFSRAEKLQRNNPILLRDKTDVSESLKNKIEQNYSRTTDAMNAWNYDEASELAEENEKEMGIWSLLNGRKYDGLQRIKNLEAEINAAQNTWDESQRKINNPVFRSDFKKELQQTTASKTCAVAGKDDNLALTNYFLGQIAQIENQPAVVYFKNSIDCRTEFCEPKLGLIESGNSTEIMGYLDDLIYFEPKNPDYYVMRGTRFLADSKTDKAENDFTKALEFDPNNEVALLKLAEVEIRKGDYSPALANLDNLLYIDTVPEAAIFAAYASLENSDNGAKDALKYVKIYANPVLDMSSARILDSLMTIYRNKAFNARNTKMQDYEAAKYYEKMFVLAGDFPRYYSDWGSAAKCYYAMGDEGNNYNRALVFADSAIVQSGDRSSDGYLIKGKIERDDHDYAESKESFYSLLKIQDDAYSNYELAETFFAEGREIVSARVYYDNTLTKLGKRKDNKLRFNAYQRLGQCYRKEGKYKLSEEQLNKAIKVYPKIGEGYYEMGLTYLANPKESKVKNAFKYYEKALSKGYDDYTILSATALTFLKLKDYSKAKKAYQQLRIKYEKSMSIDDFLNEARTFIALDELTEASANLKLIVSKNNDFIGTATYNYLQGIINLKKARGTGMSQPVVTTTLQDAKGYFQMAIQLEIADPDNYMGMGIANYYLGDVNQAVENLSKALNLGVNVEPYKDDKKFKSYFKAKPIKKELKAHK